MKFRSSNSLALFLLILGKALGIAGLIVGAYSRTIGGLLLLLDGVFIVTAIVIVLRNSREEAKEANDDKAVLARLAREGALKQYLRELEEEQKSEREGSGESRD